MILKMDIESVKRRIYANKRYKTDKLFRQRAIKRTKMAYLKNKDSIKKRIKDWREINIDKTRAYSLKYYYKNRAKAYNHVVKARSTIKGKARQLLATAIKFKRVIRPTQCSKCFKMCKPHGHHPDYTKPLEVIWLCSICHGKEHSNHP